jgi:hypothetical protein
MGRLDFLDGVCLFEEPCRRFMEALFRAGHPKQDKNSHSLDHITSTNLNWPGEPFRAGCEQPRAVAEGIISTAGVGRNGRFYESHGEYSK